MIELPPNLYAKEELKLKFPSIALLKKYIAKNDKPKIIGGKESWITKNIPSKGGVYFIFGKNNKLIYVGRSSNVRNRIVLHASKNTINSEMMWGYQRQVPADEVIKVAFLLTNDKTKRKLIENIYICLYQPKYNKIR